MAIEFGTMIRRLLTVSYRPEPTFREFLSRGETQTGPVADVTVAVAKAINEAGIEIPFPQRDLHVRSIGVSVAETVSNSDVRVTSSADSKERSVRA